jgi:general secretion pathway protein D
MKKMKSSNKTAVYIISLAFMFLFLTGCAALSLHQKKAQAFFFNGEYDKAVEYLEKAYQETPKSDLKILLFRAKLNSYYSHLAQARKLRENDKKEEAIKEYNVALGVFPDNKKLIEEVENYLHPKKEVHKPFIPSIKPPVTLDIDSSEQMSLNLKNTPITKIFNVVGKSYGVNFIFDKDFRDFVYSLEVEKIGFFDALKQLCMVGNAEYRILDKSSVLVYPNTTFKKRTFGLRGVKIFYLSDIKAKDAKTMLMAVYRDQQIMVQEDTNLNNLIIKADYNTLVEIERFLASIDKRKGEVIFDVDILEITKSLINALGADYGAVSTPVTTLTAGIMQTTYDTNGNVTGQDINSTINPKDLGRIGFNITIPSASLNFLESIDKNKIIARPNLRGLDGEEINFVVGDEVPVPQTQFQSYVPGGTSSTPVTTYQYRKVGVNVKLTPYIHSNNEVTIKIKLTINSISGYQNEFPVFGTRELENIIRLKEGETNMIGGFIRDEFRKGIRGIPALARLPVLGKLFGTEGKEVKETDLVFSITPRIIHRVEVSKSDQEPIWTDVQKSPQSTAPVMESGPRPPQGERPGRSAVIISPSKRRVPVNSEQYFTLRVNTPSRLTSLAVSGSVSGGNAVIEEVKTDFFGGQKVQVFSNFSGSSFDLGYTFTEETRAVNVIAQLKIKFTEKGNYTINIGSINAVATDRQAVELNGMPAEVEVY